MKLTLLIPQLRALTAAVVLFCAGLSGAQEHRGTWIARDALATKESLAEAMEALASNNFNVVYVNAWSRGYPLWPSQVFSNHTGIAIDPTFAGRDIMAEAGSDECILSADLDPVLLAQTRQRIPALEHRRLASGP